MLYRLVCEDQVTLDMTINGLKTRFSIFALLFELLAVVYIVLLQKCKVLLKEQFL